MDTCIHTVYTHGGLCTRVHMCTHFRFHKANPWVQGGPEPGSVCLTSELLLQCICAHRVCYLHSPPTYLGWSGVLCPPVSHFLLVSLTAFTLSSVSCVTLMCRGMGMGKSGRWGWGRDVSPLTYLASRRHQGPLTTPEEMTGGKSRPDS